MNLFECVGFDFNLNVRMRLAELADLHMTDVGRIERAERDPGVRTVAKLAAGLGVPVGLLLEGLGTSRREPQ